MITEISLHKVMTSNVVTVESTDLIWDVERIFSINHLRHAPVCEGREVVGMISLIDLRYHLEESKKEYLSTQVASKLTAREMMAVDPITVQSDQTIKEAAQLFTANEFHAIPVLEGKSLVGIISTTDVISFLIDAIERE
ncbi:MAG: CBS domain-containing protein [Saprospiraceae bacterium]|nr:CBS domain-containing protein [Saprospiraceae bacterium]